MADIYFDVDTALSEVPVNIFPLTDDTDFKTRETAVAYDASGMDLVWNFVTTAGAYTQTAVTPTTSGSYDWTHQGDGMYSIEIPSSGGASINNDSEGFGWFTGVATGILPWRSPIFAFRAAALNNALIDGGDLLDVNVTHITDTAQTGRDLGSSVLLSSGTGAGQISLSSGAVTVGTNNDKTGYTASTVSDKTGYSLSVTPPTASDIATAVWGAGTRTLSSFGTLVSDTATAIWGAVTRTITGGTITTNSDKTGYTVSTVSDKTGYSLASPQTFNLTGDITGNLSGSVGSVTGNVGGNVSGSVNSVTSGVIVTTNNDKTGYTVSTVSDKTGYSLSVTPPTAVQIRQEIDSNSTQLSAIVAKTNGLPDGIAKNVALQNFSVLMKDTSDHASGMTGLTVSGYISKDGGAFAGLSGTITELAYGVYVVDEISATEMNADIVVLRFAATGADDTFIEIKTV